MSPWKVNALALFVPIFLSLVQALNRRSEAQPTQHLFTQNRGPAQTLLFPQNDYGQKIWFIYKLLSIV